MADGCPAHHYIKLIVDNIKRIFLRGGINNKKRDFFHRFATCDMSGAKSVKCIIRYAKYHEDASIQVKYT